MNKKIHISAYSHMNIKQQFKMTKKERVLTIVLLGIIVGYGAFQIAYGTNESDYKYGHELGKADYQQCSNTNTCTVSENLLTYQCAHHNAFVLRYNPDNETACNHGHFHGWIHECLKDGGGAICKYQPGGPIIAAIIIQEDRRVNQ